MNDAKTPETAPELGGTLRARSAFISDLHLGTAGCRAELLLDFLEHCDVDHLFLVGDVIDLERMQQSVHWPSSHTAVMRQIFRLAAAGMEVTYIPGNHDARLRAFAGSEFKGVKLRLNTIHETADSRRLLVTHGDQFDSELRIGSLKERIGSAAYQWLVDVDVGINRVRERLGYDRIRLASAVKMKVASARRYIDEFECLATLHARRRGLDGIVCGHIHKPACVEEDGIGYYNDGDWVEHCSVLVEDTSGRMRDITWSGDSLSVAAPNAA